MPTTKQIDLEIYFNPLWMNNWGYALLFMAEVPLNKNIKSKEELLLYLPTRIQKLVIQWRMMNEPFDCLLHDNLQILEHYLSTEPTTVQVAQAIMQTDIYASWQTAFLNDDANSNSRLSNEDAIKLFEETTLEQYIIEGLLSDAVYE